MSNLKEKLTRLNKIHLEKKGLKENLFKAFRKTNKKKRTAKKTVKTKLNLDPELWPQIEEDIIHFNRKKRSNCQIEKLVPNLSNSWKKEDGFFLIDRKLDKFWSKYPGFIKQFKKEISPQSLKELIGVPCNLENMCFLDLETCGLWGNPLFLIGIAFFQNGHLLLKQYFARNYQQEAAVIDSFWRDSPKDRVLVTFNGKSFDWPFLEQRTYVLGNEPIQPILHYDLLHVSRRHWKGQLPNYKLQTLEKKFCRRSRHGDIPGSKIPKAYQEYVDNPQLPNDMISAIHHNALDVITMAELILVMVTKNECIGKY